MDHEPLRDTREGVETDYRTLKFDMLADAVAAGRLTMQEAAEQFKAEFERQDQPMI